VPRAAGKKENLVFYIFSTFYGARRTAGQGQEDSVREFNSTEELYNLTGHQMGMIIF
jgi:hypothetical protein